MTVKLEQPESSRVLLLTRRSRWGRIAADLALAFFPSHTEVVVAERPDVMDTTQSLLERSDTWDAIISFLWIAPVPRALLDRAPMRLNFHPGPREYPGIGCYNFALYDEVPEYGCVCHVMHAAVDTGPILRETRFPVLENESVYSLQSRTLTVMLNMFENVLQVLHAGESLRPTGLDWARPAYTRRELDDLSDIDVADLSDAERKRRVRATHYEPPAQSVEIGG